MKNKNNNIVITAVIVVVVAAAAFFGGMKYQGMQTSANTGNGQYAQTANGQGGMMGQGRFGRRGNFGGATIGQIVSVDANSITIKLQDGSSKIVNLSGSTTISKMDTASKSDLTVGQRVAAIGTTNSDGSITAQNIQLNPMFRMRPGQGGPNPTQ